MGEVGRCPNMKTKTCHISVAAAGCAILMASCAPKLTTTSTRMSTSSTATHADSSLAGTVYAKVNDYRGSIGRKPIERLSALDRMAQNHSEFMLANRGKFSLGGNKNVSHYGFEERALYAQRAMNMQNVAENVVWSGRGDIGQMLSAWKSSPGHDFNMRGEWNATGVGVAVDKDGSVFATQIFATKNTSLMTMRERLTQY
ncbi:MAG: uncharacterized protein JWO82_1000 [Akkermansiaceae bacterium]|nr:uncharacterized protein [Akkermansiaceae bacterium]